MSNSRLLLVLILVASSSFGRARATDEAQSRIARALGHSAHGREFDEGPREKPWKMEGIGASHLAITTSVPEVQQWFDQGHTLLHSFWYFEAERSFRWCLKLDPECAMAWWGLARCMNAEESPERLRKCLNEAIRRKDSVTRFERLYLEAWEDAYRDWLTATGDAASKAPDGANQRIAKGLEKIALEFPDDLESRALYCFQTMSDTARFGNEMILRDVLAKSPDHPGAHHYRIHNWDGEYGSQALESCERYGTIAPRIGHAQHMAGHIYSGIGMWQEAATWMDSATRVEKRSMAERMIFPFNDWNYRHNRNYLSYIQEQLGMVALAESGARELLSIPLDPKYNQGAKGDIASVYREGQRALLRGLIKFERWSDLDGDGGVPWLDTLECREWRPYARALAALARNDVTLARAQLPELARLEAEQAGKSRDDPRDLDVALLHGEVKGLVAHAEGKALDAYEILLPLAKKQADGFDAGNDPPTHPRFLYTVLGELYLKDGSPKLARDAFVRTLEFEKNDAFALSGLARANHALGDLPAAKDAASRLLFVWSGADPGLRWLESVKSLGLGAEPRDDSPRPQRAYDTTTLATLGPATWQPYAAPSLSALDSAGNAVTLDAYRGKNVLLVFYLGETCPHCVAQLREIDRRAAEFARRDVVVLAVSSDLPERIRESESLGKLALTLLSDADHANARRFHSYDDFEEMELHSTIYVDRDGAVRWSRNGGDAFTDFDFLLGEIDRAETARTSATTTRERDQSPPAPQPSSAAGN